MEGLKEQKKMIRVFSREYMIIIIHDTIESTEFRHIGNWHFQLCPQK